MSHAAPVATRGLAFFNAADRSNLLCFFHSEFRISELRFLTFFWRKEKIVVAVLQAVFCFPKPNDATQGATWIRRVEPKDCGAACAALEAA